MYGLANHRGRQGPDGSAPGMALKPIRVAVVGLWRECAMAETDLVV